MAENWPWESMHNTESGSSQEAKAVVEQQQQEQEQQRPSLVETLQTCLATTSSSSPSGDVTVASPVPSTALRQQQSRGVVMKRRSRASRRVPTTVVEATSSDFKETVHRLTGIAPPTAPSTPVRPQPKRAGPVTFIRPVPQVQPVPIPLPGPPAAAFWPHFDPFIKSEPSQTVVSAPFRTPSSSTQTWWDAGLMQESFSHSLMSPSTTTTTTTTGPFDVSTSSGPHIDPDLSIDDWFQHGSDFMH